MDLGILCLHARHGPLCLAHLNQRHDPAYHAALPHRPAAKPPYRRRCGWFLLHLRRHLLASWPALLCPHIPTWKDFEMITISGRIKERLPFSRQPAVIQRSEYSLAVILFRVIIIRFRNNLPINYVSCGKGFLQRAKQTEWPAPLSPPGTDSDVQCIHDRNVSFIHISILLSGNHRPLISLLPGKRRFPESF